MVHHACAAHDLDTERCVVCGAEAAAWALRNQGGVGFFMLTCHGLCMMFVLQGCGGCVGMQPGHVIVMRCRCVCMFLLRMRDGSWGSSMPM